MCIGTDTKSHHLVFTDSSEYIQSLRVELKNWEHTFTVENGRKAQRDDIKNAPEIAHKYKEYHKLRSVDERNFSRQEALSPQSKTRKRSLDVQEVDGSNKKPQYTKLHPSSIDPYDAPFSTTPVAARTYVGPTPQRNGQVLGLFDLLSPPNTGRTPSKSPREKGCVQSVKSTPSHRRDLTNRLQMTATPSKGSRNLSSLNLDEHHNFLATPSVRRVKKQDNTQKENDGNDCTPEFLLRAKRKVFVMEKSQDNEDANGAEDLLGFSPVALRMPPRPSGKGLSALVKGLRDMEEDRLNEELDILQELEYGDDWKLRPTKLQSAEVTDGQARSSIELPLGPDGDADSTDNENLKTEGLDRDGQPLKIWKKRGQKRTTRKVNIKPTSSKWKPEPAWEPGRGKENEHASASGSKLSQNAENSVQNTAKEAQTKKTNKTAHANYRALKIQKKGTKRKGVSRRFGRR